MSNKFISDLHLGHKKILEKNRKQFQSIEDMDTYIINQWNEHVDKDDDIWICGDLSYRSEKKIEEYLEKLNGKKHLIIGNHDVEWMKKTELNRYFESVDLMTVIKEVINEGEKYKRTLTLCHYPLMEWSGSRYAKYSLEGTSWMIHGHIHDSKDCYPYYQIKDNLPCALNCGCDINNFHPVTFEELLENNDKFYERLYSYRTLSDEELLERTLANSSSMSDYFMDGMK